MTDEDKKVNLEKLYYFAKTRKYALSLIQNLLHELLVLTIKLDDYKEELF